MKINRIFFPIIMILFIKNISAQEIVPSVSNLLRYGNGDRVYGNIKIKQTYFENLTDARFTFHGKLTAGFRLLFDDPPETGKKFTGISRRFIEFSSDEFYLRAGNSSALFGRGLAINLFENRGLAYDSWLDGVNLKYSSGFFNASLIAGTIDFRDSVLIVRNEIYKLKGGNFEISPLSELLIGGSFIYADGVIPQAEESSGIPPKNIKAKIPEIYLSLNLNELNFFIGYSKKITDVIEEKIKSYGWGLYSSASFFGNGFGITIDYKNYSFDIQNPYGRYDFSRGTRMLPFQNPPIVQKEHSFTLLTRPLHEVNFNDEVGFQADVFYSLNDQTTLNFNTSFSSIHNKYDLNDDGFTFKEVKRNNNFFPSFSKEYFPYFEIFFEGEYYYSNSSAVRLAAAFREKTFYNEFSSDKSSTVTNSFMIPLQIQHLFSEDYSIIFQSEYEWVNEKFISDYKYINHLITVINTFFSSVTGTIRFEYTTNKKDVSERMDWIIFEAGYRLGESHIISLSFGRERGGQVCSNGICKYIQPFEGFRFSVLSQI